MSNNNSSKSCVYCGNTTEDSQFVDAELIWPSAIGIKNPPNLFKTDLCCLKCANTNSHWINEFFLKRYSGAIDPDKRVVNLHNPRMPGIYPLKYIGTLDAFPCPKGFVCDCWLGPSEEKIFHVHPLIHKINCGMGDQSDLSFSSKNERAYIAFSSHDPYWITTAIKSFNAYFKKAKKIRLFDLPFSVPGLDNLLPKADDRDPVQVYESALLKNGAECSKPASLYEQETFSDKFLFKLALGLGHNLIGDRYLETDYAKNLQKAFWEWNFFKRDQIPVRGHNSENNDVTNKLEKKLIGIDGAWVILLKLTNQGLICHLSYPSREFSSILISDDVKLFTMPALIPFRNGQVFVIAPTIEKFIGPVGYTNFINNKMQQAMQYVNRQQITAGLRKGQLASSPAAQVPASMDKVDELDKIKKRPLQKTTAY